MSHYLHRSRLIFVGFISSVMLFLMMPPVPAQAAAGCNTTTPDLSVTVTCVTPGTESIVVPAGATQANVVVIGGGGGSGGAGSGQNSGAGGNAAVVSTTIDVVAASLVVKVAAGGRADSKGGGGGGYSSISQVVSGSDSPMVIAGGGGGGGQGLTLSGGNGGSGGNAADGGTAAGGAGGDGPPNGKFAGGKGGSDGIGGASSGGFYSAAGVNWSAGGAGGAVSDYAPGGGAGYGGGASGERASLAADGASGGGAGGSFADPVYTTTVTYSTADRSGTAPFHGAGGLSVINEVGRAGFVGKVEITFLAPPPTPTSVAGVGINNAINLSWVAPIELTGITGYQVQRATSVDGSYEDALGGCGVATTQTSTATTCQATELINGSTYFFKVRAFDGTTWTDYSAASEGITPQFSGFVTVGSAPWGVTISPDGAKAYVGNSNSGTVSVIDLSTNEVSDTINTASGAAGVVINSAGTEMYVGNFEFTGPGSVSKVNIVDNEVIRTDTADCSYAGPLQMSPKLMGTKLLYTCRNDIRSMNTSASPMTTQQIRGADEYGDLVVLDSNSYVYINTFRNQVVRATLSGSTWTFPWSFALASTPYSLAISPDGLTGVSGSLVTGTLTFFDVSTGAIIGAMNVSSGGDMTSIAYDPTGSTIYVTNKARNSVVVVDVASRVELGTIPVGAGPQRIALTPSGNKAVVTNNASNTVSILDITLQPALTPTFGVVTRTVDGYTKQISNFDADYVWGVSSSSGSVSVDGSGVLFVSGLTPGGFATATVHAARFGYAVGSATTGGDALAAAVIPTFGIPASTVNGFTVEILNWEPHVTYSLWASAGTASDIVNKFVTVTGLISGQSATLTVDTSRDGYADGQGQVTGSASAGVPSAPTIFLAGAGDGQASVTWLSPESDGGSAILSYTVTASPGVFSCTTPNGSTNTCVVTGLTNDDPYTFTVTARNAVGDGSASAAFGPITPRPAPVAPDAPTEVAGIAGDGLVDVSWLAPANNGGATIEGYQVQVATSATGVYTNAQGGCAPASTDSWSGVKCQATGLVNGQIYFFKVRAQNAVNWGSYSLASSAVTPLAPPIPIPPTPGGGGVPAPVEDQTPLQPSLPTPQKSTDSAKEVPSPKPSQGEATNTVVKSYTIEFSSGSARLSAKTKQSLDKIAQQSRLAARATTFASARLTRKGATLANRKLAEQRTRQVCSYLRSVKLKGSCSRKIWILKPGKKSIGPNIVVRMRATARQ